MKKKILGIGIVLALVITTTTTLSLETKNNNPPVILEQHYDKTSNTLWCTPFDEDGDQCRVGADWDSDTGSVDKWSTYRDSGVEHSIYPVPAGCHEFSVIVQDDNGAESEWFAIKSKTKQFSFESILIDFLEKHSNWFPILRYLLEI